MTALVTVNFHGDELLAAQENGTIWVPLKRMCEVLRIDESTQRQKLVSKPWAVAGLVTATGTDGKAYEMFCVSHESVPMWLATIDTGRVAEEMRPKLVRYQKECARVLREHFLKQEAANTNVFLPSPREIADRAARENLLAAGVHSGIAAAATFAIIELDTGVSMEPARKALPAVTEDLGGMNATQLAERVGTTAVKINKQLEALGLQERSGKEWTLTEAGKRHADAFPYTRNGHSSTQIKWRESVLDVLPCLAGAA